MAKRFTDTEKWKDDWFLELEPVMKMLWIYMLDTCDYAGVWKVNFKLASYCIGTALDRQSALNAFGDRIQVISLDKWHIPKFIAYQQKGKLNPANKAHRGIINLLEYHGLQSSPFLAPSIKSDLDQSSLGIGKGIGIGLSSSSSSSLKEECVKIEAPKIDNVIQLFNDKLSGKGRIAHCRGLSGKNIQDYITTTSYKEFQTIDTWQEVFQKTGESDFLKGLQPGSSFVATLNWLVVHDNALKVLNGQYGTPQIVSKMAKESFSTITEDNLTGNPYKAKLAQIRSEKELA